MLHVIIVKLPKREVYESNTMHTMTAYRVSITSELLTFSSACECVNRVLGMSDNSCLSLVICNNVLHISKNGIRNVAVTIIISLITKYSNTTAKH